MNRANWHQYQILTKRAERIEELSTKLQWAPHIWMGVSVESEKYVYRIDHLRRTNAHVKFLSLEPLLGPLGKINLRGIDWVIVGGESGPGARPMNEEWVTDIRRQCAWANVAFFFKQWGGVQKKKAGRLLDGRTWDEMPELAAIGKPGTDETFPDQLKEGSRIWKIASAASQLQAAATVPHTRGSATGPFSPPPPPAFNAVRKHTHPWQEHPGDPRRPRHRRHITTRG